MLTISLASVKDSAAEIAAESTPRPSAQPSHNADAAGLNPILYNYIGIRKLLLTDFRNYRQAALVVAPGPVVLVGANGAGKTNCLEAISLLTAGRGLRALDFSLIYLISSIIILAWVLAMVFDR